MINKQVTAVLIKHLNQVKQNEEQNNITETLLSKEDIVPFGFYHLFHLNSKTKAWPQGLKSLTSLVFGSLSNQVGAGGWTGQAQPPHAGWDRGKDGN